MRKVYNVLKIYQHVQYMEVVQDGRRRRRAPGVGNVGRTTLSEPLTSAIIHEGQLTLAQAYVSVGS